MKNTVYSLTHAQRRVWFTELLSRAQVSAISRRASNSGGISTLTYCAVL
ncbi:hypothetical protein ACO1DC_01145 [Bacillus velezensis]